MMGEKHRRKGVQKVGEELLRILLLVDAVCASAEYFIATDLLTLVRKGKCYADQIERLHCRDRTVHRLERLLQFRHQGTRSAVSRSAIRICLYSVFQFRNLVEDLDHRIRVARIHQIHQTRRRENATLDSIRRTHIAHKLMTFASSTLFSDTCHIRNRIARRSDQYERAKVRSLRWSEHVRILKESLPQRVANDVLLSHRQVYSSLFFAIPTRQLLHTLLKLKTTLRSDLDIIDVLSPFQNALHLHSIPTESTVFSTSISICISVNADESDQIESAPKSTQ